jgi:hypothetical protein
LAGKESRLPRRTVALRTGSDSEYQLKNRTLVSSATSKGLGNIHCLFTSGSGVGIDLILEGCCEKIGFYNGNLVSVGWRRPFGDGRHT